MHLQKTLIKIVTYIAIATITISSLAISSSMQVNAQSSTTDDNGNNVLKVLDIALNKSGISASPTTIQDFLEFMHDTVTAGAQAWSDLADTTYNTVSDYVAACKNKVADSASNIPAPAKSLINGYLDYMGKCFDTRANFDAGYTNAQNFRKYLMSYVVDVEDKQINGAISNNNKYHIKGGLVNLVRQNMDAYIEENEGYYLVPTFTYKDFSPTMFKQKSFYDASVSAMKKIDDDTVYCLCLNNVYLYSFKNLSFVIGSYSNLNIGMFAFYLYDDNWNYVSKIDYWKYLEEEDLDSFPEIVHENQFNVTSDFQVYTSLPDNSVSYNLFLVSKDGHPVKIWKSLNAFKMYSVGKSNIYYSKGYSSFDDTQDNGVTFTGNYYNGSYSHDTIQNNIDNSQTIDESTVNNIVNNYITNNNYGDGSGSGNGSGSGSGSWWEIGTGVDSFIQGVASLLDFILKLLGDLIGLLGRFLTSTLEILTSLSALGQGFGDFISASFSFLPEECITLIVSSFGVMCLIGVIKAFKG